MNPLLRHATALAGLAVIAWVGAGYGTANPLALALTVLIGVFYLAGVAELHRVQQDTARLTRVIADLAAEPPTHLRPWLDRVPLALQNAVRRRIEGEPVALPGPALAPSLAGLLVLLGMLGTFVGMVLTLRGTGAAIESTTDLTAVRNALVAPVKGLGLAFGTSVAGVAASAALGLLSALCRRERLRATQVLDARIATTLRGFSAACQREESLRLLQRQSGQMTALVDSLGTLMQAIERRAEASGAQLLASQERFQAQAAQAAAGLASSVAHTLQTSLADGARIAGEQAQAVSSTVLGRIGRDTAALQAGLAGTAQAQLDQWCTRFEASSAQVAGGWQALLARHERSVDELSGGLRAAHEHFAITFEQRSAALVGEVAARLETSVQQLHADAAAREQHRAAAMAEALEAMAATLQQEWRAGSAEALARQQHVCDAMALTARDIAAHAEQQARQTGTEIARLVQAASAAPRAAADLISEWRQQLSASLARDNTLLDERAGVLARLGGLLDGIDHAAAGQRRAIDALAASAAAALERVGTRFSDRVEAETGKLAEVAAQVTGSAVEVASLGEAFGAAVQLFSDSNDRLGAQLQRIEGALTASMARSDDQLAYYVAQAREVIDLSLLSQKQIVDELQRVALRATPTLSPAVPS